MKKEITDQEYQALINRVAYLEADNKTKTIKIKKLEEYIDSEVRKLKTEIRNVKSQSNSNKTSLGSLKSDISRIKAR